SPSPPRRPRPSGRRIGGRPEFDRAEPAAGTACDRLADTRWVQRRNASAGVAPAATCTPRDTAAVPYTGDATLEGCRRRRLRRPKDSDARARAVADAAPRGPRRGYLVTYQTPRIASIALAEPSSRGSSPPDLKLAEDSSEAVVV